MRKTRRRKRLSRVVTAVLVALGGSLNILSVVQPEPWRAVLIALGNLLWFAAFLRAVDS